MFGNLGNLAKMMQQAKEIKANMEKMKNELATAEYSACDSSMQMQATVSGDFLLKKLVAAPSLDNLSAAEIASITTEAVNNAMYKAREDAQAKMKDLTGGLDIPGLF